MWRVQPVRTVAAGRGSRSGLNMYSIRRHGFSDDDISMAETYSYHAAKALRMAVRINRLAEARTHLIAVLESRTTIDMAVGAIMAQNRCSQDAATKILKIASSTRRMKLREVAASVVASISQDPAVTTRFDA